MVHHVMQGKHNTLRLLFLNLSARFFDQLLVVLATVPGYPASVRVRPELRALVRVTNRHATRPADSWWAKPGPIPVDPWISSGFARPVGSNLPFCISGFTFMVAFRYATENRKILIMVHHGSFSMHWPLLRSTWGDTCTLPHPENERQWSVNDCWSYILGNLEGDRQRSAINVVLAALIAKRESQTLPTPSWKWLSMERQRLLVLHPRYY